MSAFDDRGHGTVKDIELDLYLDGHSTEDLMAARDARNARLSERLAFWQRQLRLQDWEITAELANVHEVGSRCALSNVNPSCKEARIRILAVAEWPVPSERVGLWDLEYFLIHELVHLHLNAWRGPAESDGDSMEYQQKEGAIDLIAGALWRLERGERR